MCDNDGFTGRVGLMTKFIDSGDITLDTFAYASGDALNDDYITWSCASQFKGWGGKIMQVNTVEDAGSGNTAQTIAGTLYIFNRPPAVQTKNAAVAFGTTDYLYLVAKITVAAGAAENTRYSFANQDVDKIYETYGGTDESPAGDTALYGIFKLSSTPTFASGTKLRIKLGVIKD